MVGLRDTLDRFRPVSTPGAPGRRGVPVDRAAERVAELGPLFALLAGTERAAVDIREQALAEAERLRSDARRRAGALVAEARVRAEALRADTAAHARVSAEREHERSRLGAESVTERVRHRAGERLPDLVARATAIARSEIEQLGATRAGRP